MAVNADHFNVAERKGSLVLFDGAFDIDAKLALFHPGGDVGMGLRVHIRIDPETDGCLLPHPRSHLIQQVEFLP